MLVSGAPLGVSAAASGSACAALDVTAPSDVTLMVDPKNQSQAVVVGADCSYESVPVRLELDAQGQSLLTLNCVNRRIRYISGVPNNVQWLKLDDNSLNASKFDAYPNLSQISLARNGLSGLSGFSFPAQLRALNLDGNNISQIAKGEIPDDLVVLRLSANKPRAMSEMVFPTYLQTLVLNNNELSAIDFALPSKLVSLEFASNPLKTMANVTFPTTLQNFSCGNCAVESIRGVDFPPALGWFSMSSSQVTDFEVQESDWAVLSKMSYSTLLVTTKQTSCRDATARLEHISSNDGSGTSISICVISDAHFTAQYRSAVKSNSTAGSLSVTASRGSSTVGIIAIVVGASVLVVAVIACASRRARRTDKNADADKDYRYDTRASQLTEVTRKPTHRNSTQDLLMNDEEFLSFRIDADQIHLVRPIAKGSYGVIYFALYNYQQVAVKRVLDEKANIPMVLGAFMDEIRMCSRVKHPRIVEFIGVSWKTLQDIAMVMEYMEHGDLCSVLSKQMDPAPTDWFQPRAQLKPKVTLALHVAEAMVYLHSFETPIIHRDVKAKNVLIDSDGEAKLSDFGMSREVTLEETMTDGVGTAAWIAPEVLRGERYGHEADIYSFGVFLVELDTCRHPYCSDLNSTTASSNMQIALRVCAGSLKARVSSQCPPSVRAVAERCLQFDPDDRPSAEEIYQDLVRLQRRTTQS